MKEDNVVDFTKRLQLTKEQAEQPIPLEDYKLGNTEILMDPSLKLDVLLSLAWGRFVDGDMDARSIHRILKLMDFVFTGFLPRWNLMTGMVVREISSETPGKDFSVYSWGFNMEHCSDSSGGFTHPGKHSYQLEIQDVAIEKDILPEPAKIYPEDWLEFDCSECTAFDKRHAKHFIRRINDLVKINGGKGVLSEDGDYVAALPYGLERAYVLVLSLKKPITLIPENERVNQ